MYTGSRYVELQQKVFWCLKKIYTLCFFVVALWLAYVLQNIALWCSFGSHGFKSGPLCVPVHLSSFSVIFLLSLLIKMAKIKNRGNSFYLAEGSWNNKEVIKINTKPFVLHFLLTHEQNSLRSWKMRFFLGSLPSRHQTSAPASRAAVRWCFCSFPGRSSDLH